MRSPKINKRAPLAATFRMLRTCTLSFLTFYFFTTCHDRSNHHSPATRTTGMMSSFGGIVAVQAQGAQLTLAPGWKLGLEVYVLDDLPTVTKTTANTTLPGSNNETIRNANGPLPSLSSSSTTTDAVEQVSSDDNATSTMCSAMFAQKQYAFADTTVTQLVNNGFGNPLNKYAWSSVLTTTTTTTTTPQHLCIGTLNVNMNTIRFPSYALQILLSGRRNGSSSGGGKQQFQRSAEDAFARFFSGSPISYSEGAEIWCCSTVAAKANRRMSRTFPASSVPTEYHEFKRIYKASSQYVGFRKMIEYQGRIYAGAANGPDGLDLKADVVQDLNLHSATGEQLRMEDLWKWSHVLENTIASSKDEYSNINRNIFNRFFSDAMDQASLRRRRRFQLLQPYSPNTIQQDIYGPEQPAMATQGAALFAGYPDGTQWEHIATGDALTTWDRSIRAMCVSNHTGRLWIGTESLIALHGGRGSKILVHSAVATNQSNDTATTTTADGFTILGHFDNVAAVSECIEVLPGRMLFGTWNGNYHNIPRLIVIDETRNDAVSIIQNAQLEALRGYGVMELQVFHNELYVGIFDYNSGFKLVKTKQLADLANANWTIITDNGFRNEQIQQLGMEKGRNAYPWSSAVVGGIYYIGTISIYPTVPYLDTRAQLWASCDGTEWIALEDDAFGEAYSYGFRVMETDGQRLYLGTASSVYQPIYSELPYDARNRIPRLSNIFPIPLRNSFPLVN